MKKKKINSRAKGSSYERDIAKKLSKWSNINIRRSPQSGGWNQRGDLTPVNPEDMVKWPFNFELKKRQGWRLSELLTYKNRQTGILSWWDQSLKDAKVSKKIPVLVFSKNFDNDYVCIEKVVFKKLELKKKIRNYLINKNLIFFLLNDLLKVSFEDVLKKI